MVPIGTRLYGKVDQVPGLCYVATQCFHVGFLPLLPLGTYAIFSQDGQEWDGEKLPLNSKSFLVGFLRTLLVFIGIATFLPAVLLLGLTVAGQGPEGEGLELSLAIAGIFVVDALALFGTYKLPAISRATYKRAIQIAGCLKDPERKKILVDVEYGRINRQEAGVRLAKLTGSGDIPARETRAASGRITQTKPAKKSTPSGRVIGKRQPETGAPSGRVIGKRKPTDEGSPHG